MWHHFLLSMSCRLLWSKATFRFFFCLLRSFFVCSFLEPTKTRGSFVILKRPKKSNSNEPNFIPWLCTPWETLTVWRWAVNGNYHRSGGPAWMSTRQICVRRCSTQTQTKLTHCLTVSLRATVAGRGRLSQVAASNAISRCPQRANWVRLLEN